MGFLGSVCRLVGALTILCEVPSFAVPDGTPFPPVLATGLKQYLKTFQDTDPSGREIALMASGIALVWQPLFCYIVCTVVPGLIVLALCFKASDGESKWVSERQK
ncbi:hypothetical protein BC830DRAFT_1124717 [Chytriomyces sp. MP71]|nr:hypothetical protein BC830DRAFT_1124717 [Chytriomyces sp. MP71]